METVIPAREGHGEYEEKHSRFIGGAYFVETEQDVGGILSALKKKYFDARHIVYCYRLKDGTVRFSDDGEPHGTAAKPMMAVMDGEKLSCCLVTVTRYFGGTLLGTGGLVRAYTEAAKAAIADAGKEVLIPLCDYSAEIEYGQYDKLVRELEKSGAFNITAEFNDKVKVFYTVPKEDSENTEKNLLSTFFGSVVPKLSGEKTGKNEKIADFRK